MNPVFEVKTTIVFRIRQPDPGQSGSRMHILRPYGPQFYKGRFVRQPLLYTFSEMNHDYLDWGPPCPAIDLVELCFGVSGSMEPNLARIVISSAFCAAASLC
jgi:hypothetical protein